MTSKRDSAAPPGDLAGREVVVGICGGIAAYKVCAVVSALVQRGAGVTCVMTRSARRFVTPLTFEALSGRKVLTSLWRPDYAYDAQHIQLTDRADLFLIAPATANIIAKTACGIADDLLSTLLTAVACPVILAPAMNERMWANPVVQANVERLRGLGYTLIGPGEGWLACRSRGPGRMEEADILVAAAAERLAALPPRT
ncbi:MAG TPA: bifunctional phosphopantothenoylcysteine decarboxylase/phosphopantothenate--cysteine ligase CoaBC [Phycisphaerae bacterium]|mgnify:CR=1 FL=1|nr:bifunctional phosphopantothenoylcysteine decarboxylase/phosphopantothenate--cysteine ligase CoaBC [Phycisphaerae bacterium]